VSTARAGVEAQKTSNRSALPHAASFAGHRARLTAIVAADLAPGEGGRLCVLGAGNCHDLDLARLAALFDEIHLVDIDPSAIEGARDRQDAQIQSRIFCHAPIDLSGLVDRVDRWKQMQVTPEELMNHPADASRRIVEALPGPFDVVLSACVLTQLQLFALEVLTPTHRLFEAVRQVVNLTHLRTLARLITPEGRAILATDVISSKTYPLHQLAPGADLTKLMAEVLDKNAIYAAHPGLIAWMGGEDPMLSRTVRISAPSDVWLWNNGPELVFLVYALEMTSKAAEPAT
jgi:hypothetical protein